MIVGYARVSTLDQNLELQINDLKNAGCEKIFADKISGSTKSRPELDKCLEFLQPGYTLKVWRLDRLGRSAKDLISHVENFKTQGVNFVSLKESIDTTTDIGQMFFYICAWLAQMELNLIKERTRAGLIAAKKRGRMGGRPEMLNESQKELLWEMHSNGKSIQKIRDVLNISRPSVYRYINSMKKTRGSE